jgi:hypothetical protein
VFGPEVEDDVDHEVDVQEDVPDLRGVTLEHEGRVEGQVEGNLCVCMCVRACRRVQACL